MSASATTASADSLSAVRMKSVSVVMIHRIVTSGQTGRNCLAPECSGQGNLSADRYNRSCAAELSLSLDVRRLDDRPPLLDLGRVVGAQGLRCLLFARENLLAGVGQPLAHARI